MSVVASHKSQVASDVAFGDGMEHWALGILLRHLSFERGYAPLCRLNRGQKVGSRFSPSHLLTFFGKRVAQQRKPKSFIIHHPSSIIHHSPKGIS
ncbi:hypothetical protein [Nitratifractor sp.]